MLRKQETSNGLLAVLQVAAGILPAICSIWSEAFERISEYPDALDVWRQANKVRTHAGPTPGPRCLTCIFA